MVWLPKSPQKTSRPTWTANSVDFVSGLENEGRKVTEFLGLQWHPDQSAFHENARKNSATLPPITRYAAALEPYQESLAPYCRAFGYDG